MADLKAITAANAQRWAKARTTRDFTLTAKRLVSAKARYQTVASKTGVPWFIVAVIHEREASQSWSANIAQGDPWTEVSVHVPAGRGPFLSWEGAAVDALSNCAPYAARWTDWSAGGALTLLETYNGTGYANKGLPSPYIWSGTDQYEKGKYVSDGKFDPEAIDKQLGCAGLIRTMMVLDPTITFTGLKITTTTISTAPAKPSRPSITHPSKGSIGDVIARLIAAVMSIFKR